jgi:hypothetical protein
VEVPGNQMQVIMSEDFQATITAWEEFYNDVIEIFPVQNWEVPP